MSLIKRSFATVLTTALMIIALTGLSISTASARSRSSNSAPVISGTPATSAMVGTIYKFQPTATDANGDTLTFSISNKPVWTTFSSSTGLLTGTPTAAGTYANIIISVSDGRTKRSLTAFSITAVASSSSSSSSSNVAPTISGTPSASVTVGNAYTFTPTAQDANGDALGFSISNKPSWATFNTATGQLSGTPTSSNVGSYSAITISVSDGVASTALGAFAITVAAAPVTTGSAYLNWIRPTLNNDGSALTDLAGYKIYYGTSSGSLTNSVTVSADLTNYTINALNLGTWYFAVSSVNAAGVEGAQSSAVAKTL